jgi:hypothetical protein
MPTLQDLYRDNYNYHPEYHTHLLDWIDHLIAPFHLPELAIFLEPDYIFLGTHVSLQTPWGTFRTALDTKKALDGGRDWIAQQVATQFAEWFRSLYIPPGENIELGEN